MLTRDACLRFHQGFPRLKDVLCGVEAYWFASPFSTAVASRIPKVFRQMQVLHCKEICSLQVALFHCDFNAQS